MNGSLEISAKEQVRFLRNMHIDNLGVSQPAMQFMKDLFFQEKFLDWNLYGKTGSGRLADGRPMAWYMGWIENQGHILTFAHYCEGQKKEDAGLSLKARANALNQLQGIFETL